VNDTGGLARRIRLGEDSALELKRVVLAGGHLHVPGALANTLTPDTMYLRQSSRNELIVSLLARCGAPADLGRLRLMDRRGDGVPIIREECKKFSGRLPEYTLIDDSELRLVIPAAKPAPET